MPINPQIVLSGRQVEQIDDPLKAFAEVQGVRNLISQRQANEQESLLRAEQLKGAQAVNQARDLDMEDERALQQIWGETGGNPEAILKAAAGKVRAKTYLGIQKSFMDARKEAANITNQELPTLKYRDEQVSGLITQALALPPDQYAAQWPVIAETARKIDPALKIPEQPIPQDQLGVLRYRFTTRAHILAEEEEKRKQAAESQKELLRPLEVKKETGLAAGAETEAQQKARVLAGTSPTGVTAAQTAQALAEAGRFDETKRHNRAIENKPQDQRLVQVMGPQGTPIWVRENEAVGKPAAQAARAVTGAERKEIGFYNRGLKALETIVTPDKSGLALEDRIAKQNALRQQQGDKAWNILQTKDQQAYTQAQRAFTEARLRDESGAAVPPHEYAADRATYFFIPGDDEKTIKQKQEARQVVIDGIAFKAGKAYDEYYGEPFQTPARKAKEGGGGTASGTIRARDPQGNLHEAPGGTPLPAGWKEEKAK